VTVHRKPARRGVASVRIDEPTLIQFVVLSMLVHVLVIILFGDASRGGARRGEDLLGALDVTLRRLSPEPGSGFKLAPGSDTASPGAALLPRPQAPVSAPAARPSVEPSPAESPPVPEPLPIERSETPPLHLPESPAPAPIDALPRLNPNALEEVDKTPRPGAVAPPKIEPSPQRIEPIAPPRIERNLSPPIEMPARAVPTAPAVPLERVAPPQIQREIAAPAELPRREVPIVPSIPLERVAPAPVERELAPSTELPRREMPLAPGGPLERSAPPTIERELAPPVEVPLRAVPAAPGASIEPVAPPNIERQIAPPVSMPSPRPLPAPAVEPQPGAAPSAVPSQRVPTIESERPVGRAAPPAIAPPVAPTRPSIAPALRQGTPDADEDIFKPRRDGLTPSTEPGATPRIDLDAAKKRAVRAIANEGSGSRGVLPFPLPVPPSEKKSKDAMEKAIKPDCRTAYAGLGLLAVPALVAAAITDEGCRW